MEGPGEAERCLCLVFEVGDTGLFIESTGEAGRFLLLLSEVEASAEPEGPSKVSIEAA